MVLGGSPRRGARHADGLGYVTKDTKRITKQLLARVIFIYMRRKRTLPWAQLWSLPGTDPKDTRWLCVAAVEPFQFASGREPESSVSPLELVLQRGSFLDLYTLVGRIP